MVMCPDNPPTLSPTRWDRSQLFIPVHDKQLHTNGGVILYLLGLGYCFMGVAVVSDVFMSAIETITSEEQEVKRTVRIGNKLKERTFHVRVWNATIANLTLMALGSSAPEILLNVIEICGNGFYAGELGPSTIVGSAAFNLMIILAVCVMAIPDGQSRTIRDFGVFKVTAVSSVLAYIWLLVIVCFNTPDYIDVWEGTLTFAFFPVLVTLAYGADKGWFGVRPVGDGTSHELGHGVHDHEIVAALSSLEKEVAAGAKDRYASGIALDHLALAQRFQQELHRIQDTKKRRSKAYYRLMESSVMHGKTVMKHHQARLLPVTSISWRRRSSKAPTMADLQTEERESRASQHRISTLSSQPQQALAKVHPAEVVEMTPLPVSLTTELGRGESDGDGLEEEGAGVVALVVAEGGDAANDENKAEAKLENKALQNIMEKRLAAIEAHELEVERTRSLLEAEVRNEISLEGAGSVIDFHRPAERDGPFTVLESMCRIDLLIVRRGSLATTTSCTFCTKDGTAVAGSDYVAQQGTIAFAPDEAVKLLCIEIIDDSEIERKFEDFTVVLSDATNGATFDPMWDGAGDRAIIKINIVDDTERCNFAADIARARGVAPFVNRGLLNAACTDWRVQFSCAVTFNFEGARPTCHECVMFALMTPWNVLFALVPPPSFKGGWVCFSVALIFIGALTAVIGDLAMLLGDSLGINTDVTAITFVALGTSLPDTFASKAAAVVESHADAAIGNVVGSNSVNVFLGLGLPWMIASVYWRYFAGDAAREAWRRAYGKKDCFGDYHLTKDSHPFNVARKGGRWDHVGFLVKQGSLGVSVAVFSIAALITIGILIYRRQRYGAELGGPRELKRATAASFVSLWLLYIAVSTAKSYGLF